MSEPEVGATASAAMTVRPSDLASAFRLSPEDAFPPVFATARMVALMELASARILAPHLAEGERSVGVLVEVTHTAATPEGAAVEAEARYLGREGKHHRFEVVARDRGGEIGRGRHARAVVSSDRLVAGAGRRAAQSGGASPTPVPPESGLTDSRCVGLSRAAIRLREGATTLGAWKLTFAAREGEGAITLVEPDGQPPLYRGEGVCLGWSQERLTAAYAALRPGKDEPELELPQLG